MIFIMSEKQFMENKRKLVKMKDYMICDCADGKILNKFNNAIAMEEFNPPKALIKMREANDRDYDYFRSEKLEKKYFKGSGFRTSAMGIMKCIELRGDINVFVILTKKGYKYFKDDIVENMKKLFDTDKEFIYTFSDLRDNQRLLTKDYSDSYIDSIVRALHKTERKLTKKKKEY